MKKAALLMAALYLLLTTGTYVCVLSCGTNNLIGLLKDNTVSKSHNQIENHKACHQEREKDCKGDQDCSCCKKHGNYIVKENIKPDITFVFLEIPAIAESAYYSIFNEDYPLGVAAKAGSDNSDHPPPGVSPPIYIKIKSLLI